MTEKQEPEGCHCYERVTRTTYPYCPDCKGNGYPASQTEAKRPRFPLRDADWLVDEMLEERNQQRFDWLKDEIIRRAEHANPKGLAWDTEPTHDAPTQSRLSDEAIDAVIDTFDTAAIEFWSAAIEFWSREDMQSLLDAQLAKDQAQYNILQQMLDGERIAAVEHAREIDKMLAAKDTEIDWKTHNNLNKQ